MTQKTWRDYFNRVSGRLVASNRYLSRTQVEEALLLSGLKLMLTACRDEAYMNTQGSDADRAAACRRVTIQDVFGDDEKIHYVSSAVSRVPHTSDGGGRNYAPEKRTTP